MICNICEFIDKIYKLMYKRKKNKDFKWIEHEFCTQITFFKLLLSKT